MKSVRMAMAALALCGMMSPALAGANCATPEEAQALKAAAVQQQLMVAAFMCRDRDAYNRFVMTYQGELQGSDAMLKAYFVRQGRHGEADYDSYKTRAANLSALDQARDAGAFCALAGELFAAALESRAPLDALIAAAPPAPGVLDVCVERPMDRGSLHMAQAGPDK